MADQRTPNKILNREVEGINKNEEPTKRLVDGVKWIMMGRQLMEDDAIS